VARALITYDDELLRDIARTIVKPAKHHDAHTLYRLQTGPGMGQLLRLVLLYAIPQIDRFPRGPDCASYGRLGTCATESAGKRSGTSGTKIGQAPLKGACSAAAVFFLRDTPAGQQCLPRWENTHRQGKALTIFAPTWARAVYGMGKPKTAFDMSTFLHGSGRGGGELAASRDNAGMPLPIHALPYTTHCVAARR
jgi:hypothetical protein